MRETERVRQTGRRRGHLLSHLCGFFIVGGLVGLSSRGRRRRHVTVECSIIIIGSLDWGHSGVLLRSGALRSVAGGAFNHKRRRGIHEQLLLDARLLYG
jgi:hypothetical protein